LESFCCRIETCHRRDLTSEDSFDNTIEPR